MKRSVRRLGVGVWEFDADGFGAVVFGAGGGANWNWDLGAHRSAGAAGVCATALSGSGYLWTPVIGHGMTGAGTTGFPARG